MNVLELKNILSKYPDDMEVIGGSDKHEYPTDLDIYNTYWSPSLSKWKDSHHDSVIAVVIWCSY